MKNGLLLGAAIALAACTQPAVQVYHKGDQYFGRDGRMMTARMDRPLYSDTNRAQQPPQIAAKYRSQEHHYSAPAALDPVRVETLSPPEPISVAEVSAPYVSSASSAPTPAEPVFNSLSPSPQPQLAPLPITEAYPLPQAEGRQGESKDALLRVVEATQSEFAPVNEQRSNFIWPVEGKIISRFGPKQGGLVNDGINIEAPEGEPIWAAARGEVVYAGNELKGYGNMMIIRHENGSMTAYAHTSDMLVDKGDRVNQGDLIGYVGRTGSVTTAQLHFGIREGDKPVDPETLLPQRVAAME